MEVNNRRSPLAQRWSTVARWFDSGAGKDSTSSGHARHIDWPRLVPFLGLHLGCFAVFWVGASTTAVLVAVGLYVLRMFAITGFYHRYFSHRAFRTSRAAQLAFAILGACGVQRGPLWWAAQHRHHHAYADLIQDSHSSLHRGFLWSHIGWFMARESFATRTEWVRELVRFPELRFLDRYDTLVPALLLVALYLTGALFERFLPDLGTSGMQLVVWGFCISTVILYHATFAINSLAHHFGRRRYATRDASRNSFWLAVLTFGEGWHNNHHHYPGAARQGFYWWEVDLTYYFLRLLAWLGIIWELREVPVAVREARRIGRPQT
jgi:stearoyl-CoA desaturase (delta-9 desaturase)